MSGPDVSLSTLVSILVIYIKDEGKVVPVLNPYHIEIGDLNPRIMGLTA
jgi:hypothetical protein